ncbi:MAG: hypothetical protein ACTSPV_14085 [Candidatus Hodarchaeales archaeon]
MNSEKSSDKKRFYLLSTDILQGISIFLVVLGHTTLWWDNTLDSQYPNLPFIPLLFLRIAFLVVPGFLFWYSFNSTNSLMRKKTNEEKYKSRIRLIKRTIIFFVMATMFELMAAIVSSPENILNSLFNWQLFHMFSLSTIFVLVSVELSWWLSARFNRDYKKILTMIYMTTIFFVVIVFLAFHNYNEPSRLKLYVDLNIESILRRILLDDGQSPIFPYLSFSAAGGFLAAFLDLPNQNKDIIVKRSRFAMTSGLLFILGGISLLSIEEYISTPTGYPSSSSFAILSIGIHLFLTTLLILLIDLDTLYTRRSINKAVLPLVLFSKITLTVFVGHNILFSIPNDFPIINMLITDIHLAMLFGAAYALLFVALAFVWQKWRFKYSLEWIILVLQDKSWVF